jgi:hypothetical protein
MAQAKLARWRTWSVSTQKKPSRIRLLQHRANALRASKNLDLPEEIRAKYREAANHAEVALEMQRAAQRRTIKGLTSSDGH